MQLCMIVKAASFLKPKAKKELQVISEQDTIIWPMYHSSPPPPAGGRPSESVVLPTPSRSASRGSKSHPRPRARGRPCSSRTTTKRHCLRIAGGSLGLTRDAPPNSRTAVVAKAAAATACHRQRRRGELAPPLASCRGQRRRERQPC